jgi:hypothetical protein
VLDVARAVGLVWAVAAAWRARGWREGLVLAAFAYVFALEVASGFTVRDEGPLMPLMAVILVFLGPSAMPRGHLPALPLAWAVVGWPTVLSAARAGLLALASSRTTARARALPEHADATPRVHGLAVALFFLAVLDVMSAVARALPAYAEATGER